MCHLKYFSLTCCNGTFVYDQVIVPHLQRMSNLEKLALYLAVNCPETFIDGDNLRKNILDYMSSLNELVFDICSSILLGGQTHLPTKEDIQRTLANSGDLQIISCVDYFPKDRSGNCHIYTCPYTLTHYDNITNNFPDEVFRCVRVVSLFDERSFEHTFFVRLARAFPFLEELSIHNLEAQMEKSTNDKRNLPIIEYPHLNELFFIRIHDDYAEQFLFDTKTSLPNGVRLIIDEDILQRVTHNFTRDLTRVNCAKVKKFDIIQ